MNRLRRKHGLFGNETLTRIGRAHGKSAAQVALRWNAQRGSVVIPKSTRRERMEENLAIWDFELAEAEMADIAKLDLGTSAFIGHRSVESVRMRHTLKIHD